MSESINLYPEMNEEIVNLLLCGGPVELYAAKLIETLFVRVGVLEVELAEARIAKFRGGRWKAIARKLAEKYYYTAEKINENPSGMCVACGVCTGEDELEGYSCEDAILDWAMAEADLPEPPK